MGKRGLLWTSSRESRDRRRPLRFLASLSLPSTCLAIALTGAALAGCGNGSNSSSISSTSSRQPPVGTISAAKALDVAKKSRVVGKIAYCLTQACSETYPPPQLRAEGAWYVMPGTHAKIARDPGHGMRFQLGAHGGFGTGNATPIDLASSASAAIPVVNNRGLFFANTYPSVDTVFTPDQVGVEMKLVIRGPSAPSEFSWRVVGSETQLVGQPKSESAGLIYRIPHHPRTFGFPLSIQVDPFPHDSAGYPQKPGTKLETQLTASGDQVTVRVDHSSGKLIYPLVVPIGWQSNLFH
jgi:hypothetical protein